MSLVCVSQLTPLASQQAPRKPGGEGGGSRRGTQAHARSGGVEGGKTLSAMPYGVFQGAVAGPGPFLEVNGSSARVPRDWQHRLVLACRQLLSLGVIFDDVASQCSAHPALCRKRFLCQKGGVSTQRYWGVRRSRQGAGWMQC